MLAGGKETKLIVRLWETMFYHPKKIISNILTFTEQLLGGRHKAGPPGMMVHSLEG